MKKRFPLPLSSQQPISYGKPAILFIYFISETVILQFELKDTEVESGQSHIPHSGKTWQDKSDTKFIEKCIENTRHIGYKFHWKMY